MSWSGGVFTRTNGTYAGTLVWTQDAAANIDILANRHDTHDQDLASGINACINKAGQNSPTANISWGGFKITNLANGAAATDAAAYGQTITSFSYTASTGTITGNRSAGNLDLVIPIFDATGRGLVPASGTPVGRFLSDSGDFASLPAGAGDVPVTRKTASFTAVAGNAYTLAANSIEVTLPASPTYGDMVVILFESSSLTGCTVNRNGETIMGVAENMTLDTDFASFGLMYAGAGGWRII